MCIWLSSNPIIVRGWEPRALIFLLDKKWELKKKTVKLKIAWRTNIFLERRGSSKDQNCIVSTFWKEMILDLHMFVKIKILES